MASGRERLPPAASAWAVWLIAFSLSICTAVVYLNGLQGPFVFDDIPSIPNNPTLRQLWPLGVPLSPPGDGATVSGRPVLNLSFALNAAAVAGPAGFRLTNVAIHICAGLLLFGLLRRTLERPRAPCDVGAASLPLAAMISGLWLLHPIQTASVTYVVQRAESLMGCFYLLTLYSFVRGVDSSRPTRWFACSWLACLMGMATKEVMVSAPMIVALYDRMFVSASWREVWQRRKYMHFALASTWLLLAWLVSATGGRGGAAGFSLGVDGWTYWATQFQAVAKYLWLAVWPHPLVLDYGAQWVGGIGDVVPYAIGMVALATVTAVAFVRRRAVAFLGIWFFAILAPTSVMPGGRQTMADHRMYLPLAAVMAFIVLETHRRIGRRAFVGGAIALVLFSALSIRRNLDYRSTLSIWADTVAKQPANRWARDNLGNALLEVGRASDALQHYEAALELAPADPVHHYNAGNALMRLNRVPEAIARFTEAVRLNGNYLPPRTNLGNALCRVGRFDEAITHYTVAVRAEPNHAGHHANLADAFFRAGRTGEAIAEFRAASGLQPNNPDLGYGLGCILLQTGRPGEAVTEFERVLRLNPTHAEAHNNLGSAFAQLGRVDDALRHVREAARLNPENAEAHNNLGALYLHLGRRDEAIAEFIEALRLAPNHVMARQNLERVRR